MNEYDEQVAGLDEAARRAGAIIMERIEELVSTAERRAGEIHEHAEASAEAVRHETIESSRRVFERLDALERPLAELASTLKEEKQRFAHELEAGATARELPPGELIAEPPSTDGQPHTQDHPSPQTEEEEEDPSDDAQPAGDSPNGADTTTETDQPDAQPRAAVATVAPPAAKPRRGLFRRQHLRAFIDTPGECAVCERPFQAGSEQELKSDGWRMKGQVGLCPDCQSNGWELSKSVK